MNIYRDERLKNLLINLLKTSAQTLIDNAEEIVGDYNLTEDIDIYITIKTNEKELGIPDIRISKEYIPPVYECFQEYSKCENYGCDFDPPI